MKTLLKAAVLVAGAVLSAPWSTQALAETPQFKVDPSWPKALPNNWLLGQVANIAVDSHDHVWVLQRPRTLTDDEKGTTLKPPRNKIVNRRANLFDLLMSKFNRVNYAILRNFL